MAERIRLLICNTCKTTEELPDYQGPPEHDVLLAALASRHVFPDGNKHLGHLADVEKQHWDSKATRRGIENQIRESAGHTGLDTEFYASKNTFQEDALKCWQQHNRTPACGDYKSDKKKLVPDTAKDRKDLGLSPSTVTNYLCQFCPVHSLVMQAKRDKAGLSA
jgi:hypothetical protein